MPDAPASTPAGNGRNEARDFTLAITLAALGLRLTVALVVAKTLTAEWLFSQATELGCMANSVLHGNGLASPFCGKTGPSAFLAPGYPLFVALVFRWFGSFTMHSAAAILFVQALLGTALIPIVTLAARRAFGTRTANLAGLLCAVNPWLIGLEAVLWETTLSIFLLTALVGVAIVLRQRPSRSRWYAAAALLTCAVYVNPSLVFTGFALLLVAWLQGPKQRSALWLAPLGLLLCVCSLWPARNVRVLHAWVPLRSNMGYELWQGNRSDADGFFQAKLHPNVNKVEYQRYRDLGEMMYMQEKSALATSWIRAHPRRFAALTAKRIACFWLGIARTPSALIITSSAALSLAGLAALLALWRVDRRLSGVFAIPVLLLPLPYYISHPDFRFWCLLAPTLTILVAWWITHAAAIRSRQGSK